MCSNIIYSNMLPTTGYFNGINCPFYDSGLCERPYCHFRHSKKDTQNTVHSVANDDVLQRLLTEAVKKVLQHPDPTNPEVRTEILNQLSEEVVQNLNPKNNSASSKATYNPTPISELEKCQQEDNRDEDNDSRPRRHIPVPYTPYRPSVQIVRRDINEKKEAFVTITTTTENSDKTFALPRSDFIYLPGSKNHNPDPYLPHNSGTSNGTYLPGSAQTTALPSYEPTESTSTNSLSYVPTSKSIISNVRNVVSKYEPVALKGLKSKNSSFNYSPTSIQVKSVEQINSSKNQLEYEPVPLKKTKYPCFSSDEDEPIIKKEKTDHSNTNKNELNDLDELDPEFEILGQIIDEEKDEVNNPISETNNVPKVESADRVIKDKRHDKKSDKKSHTKNENSSKHKNKNSSKHSSRGSKKDDSKPPKTFSKKEKIKDESNSHRGSSGSSKHKSHSSSKEKEAKMKIDKESKKNIEKESKTKSDQSIKSHKDQEKKEKTSKHSSSHKSDKKNKHSESKSNPRESKDKRESSKDDSKSKSRSHSKTSSSKNHSNSKSIHKSEKKIHKEKSRSKENLSGNLSSDNCEPFIDLVDQFSESDEDAITEECKKIFDEYIPIAKKDVMQDNSSTKDVSEKEDTYLPGKKRISYAPEKTTSFKPVAKINHKANAAQAMALRLQKVKEFHESRSTTTSEPISTPIVQITNPGSTGCARSKVRIAHVSNVSTLLNAKKNINSVSSPPINTVAQTISKGQNRVAHVPNDTFSERPGVLEPLASKIPVNLRSQYLNMMIDECLKIYIEPIDAYARAQEEELKTSKKCSAVQIYKNSAVLTVNRLRKELLESGGGKRRQPNDGSSDKISHSAVLIGKFTSSWSIENKSKKESDFSNEFSSVKLYQNIVKWILSEEQLQENGYPRTHPSGEKGRAQIYTVNKIKRPTGNIRNCCRCKKEYLVDKKGFPTRKEECIYHPNRKFTFRSQTKYQCCGQDGNSDGCLVAPCHVFEYLDYDNLSGFVKTLPKDSYEGELDSDYGVYALDCEMCYTTRGLDLTRVTVINSSCRTVYETFIKPVHPIIDYNTQFSGITADHMKDVTTSLLEVQANLLHLFSDKTILIGHSLDSDFKVLKIIHDTVIDTSIIFPHRRGPPFKRALRNLSSEYLKKIIQNSVEGHDSAEDATVCMELVLWKLKEELKLR